LAFKFADQQRSTIKQDGWSNADWFLSYWTKSL
jgi:hypothetical protein